MLNFEKKKLAQVAWDRKKIIWRRSFTVIQDINVKFDKKKKDFLPMHLLFVCDKSSFSFNINGEQFYKISSISIYKTFKRYVLDIIFKIEVSDIPSQDL